MSMVNKKKSFNDSPKKDTNSEKIAKENLEVSPLEEELLGDEAPTVETEELKHESKPEEIQKLREKIEKTDLDDSLKIQASSHAKDIKALDDAEKIKKLLSLAKAKGVVYAVHVAQKMENSYILDMLHDILAKEGYYKEFLK